MTQYVENVKISCGGFFILFDMLFRNSILISAQSGAVFHIANFNYSQCLRCEIKVLSRVYGRSQTFPTVQ